MERLVWRLSLAVAVLCIGSASSHSSSSSAQVDLMSRLLMQRDYGVKLCGREFIRAVIFTCGGSRWRRATNDDFELQQWVSQDEATEEETQQSLGPVTDVQSPLHSSASHSLADLLAIYGALEEKQPQQQLRILNEPNPLEKPQSYSADPHSPLTENWSNKKKRNFSQGVAGMCCSQGCTKNDIGRLC
ncbi:hypothetical protein WMY93_021592 [Mugilogobius chulae]|uniref:Insulin-like domain-containing protein n=1 Tax=Mugilogobius chulae TaxID=88201 RepID=A0AAW0NLM6_9GOBI